MPDTVLPPRKLPPAPPPARTRRPERGLRSANRLALALTSVLLCGAAWYAVTAAHSVGGPPRTLPDWWPGASASGALPGSRRWHALLERADPATGVPLWQVLAVAVPALLLLGALAWLLRQLGPRTRRLVGVPGTDARLRGVALAAAVTADAREVPGVRRARATVHGRAGRPWLRLRVTLDADAQPAAVLRQLEQDVVARARTASGCAALRATVRLRVVSHRPNRVAESAVQRVR